MIGTERREHLKEYILSCIRDSAISWNDLKSPAILDKLLQVLSRDVKVVIGELGQTGGAGLLRIGATMLAGFAENVVKRTLKKE